MSGSHKFHAEFSDLEMANPSQRGLNRPRCVAGRWGDDDEDEGYGSYNGYSSDRAYDNWDEDEDEFRDEEDDFLEVDERPSWLREAEGRRRSRVDEEGDDVVIVRESKVTTTVSHPEPGVTEISTTEVTIETPLHVISAEPAIEIEARPVPRPAKKAATKAATKKAAAKAVKKVSVKAVKKASTKKAAVKTSAKKAATKPAKKVVTKKAAKKAAKKIVAKKAVKKPVKKIVVKKPAKKVAAKKAVKKPAKKTAKKAAKKR